MLYGMAFLQENQMVHGDIRPSLIQVPLVPTENFRLLDRLGNSSTPDKIQKINIQAKNWIYTSPALFKGITKNKNPLKHNPFKSDIFSFGMILLEAGTLESVQKVYDLEKKQIDEEELINLVQKFVDRYSDTVLQEGLMIMLEFSEKLRQDPVKLLNSIRELKEIEVKEGRTENSIIQYTNDHMMNKVRITESGYEFNDARDQMLISNFSRIYNKGGKGVSQEETDQEMERSFAEKVKERNSNVIARGNRKQVNKMVSLQSKEVQRNFKVRMETIESIPSNTIIKRGESGELKLYKEKKKKTNCFKVLKDCLVKMEMVFLKIL